MRSVKQQSSSINAATKNLSSERFGETVANASAVRVVRPKSHAQVASPGRRNNRHGATLNWRGKDREIPNMLQIRHQFYLLATVALLGGTSLAPAAETAVWRPEASVSATPAFGAGR